MRWSSGRRWRYVEDRTHKRPMIIGLRMITARRENKGGPGDSHARDVVIAARDIHRLVRGSGLPSWCRARVLHDLRACPRPHYRDRAGWAPDRLARGEPDCRAIPRADRGTGRDGD